MIAMVSRKLFDGHVAAAKTEGGTPILGTQGGVPRQRFLTVSAAAFFGLAGKALFPGSAQAYHTCGFPPCSGGYCCDCCVAGPGCTCCQGLDYHNHITSACWVCCYGGHKWKCCDFWQSSQECVCRLYLGDPC
jgi:hypothetical protein